MQKVLNLPYKKNTNLRVIRVKDGKNFQGTFNAFT